MESVKDKKNFLVKTWKRCRSFSHSHSTKGGVSGLPKSKSWSGNEMNKKHMSPVGFFPVYVGPEKQRFTIKTKYASHPLFLLLLEDAESEYGTHSDGLILLPCDVAMFYRVLAEMK
ncbi:small auxin-up RNA [Tanacetum coccineum]